ncbi:MAG TPA: biotin carboxylase N-terminal domain-containing protein [Galbitalea sp.]|jgi:acetyl-CoA/propionyl-CoA carboxylase biotin carboxyl carrier protein
MFESVLVANRGEIACRIIETLRKLGIRSIAVYSDADVDARHVALADEALNIGPAAAAQSYLNIQAIIAAARTAGASAVHPGYGFLSENAEFARAVADAGIVFIGPPVAAIDIMGDKIRAKEHVGARDVPLIRGVGAKSMTDGELVEAAASVGFPLIIKPSAGGGGKGMTVVTNGADLADALVATRRVALNAFGDDTLLLERYIPQPRHIEVQVLADDFGSVVHLGERECSLQRRHQKIIEEAPSPLLSPEQRARMGEAACEVARSVDYRGVGTVEFLVSAAAPDDFFFMEMNTRLQVEHPVTELVTGLDLVEQQLRVASGEPLAFGQADVSLSGHAIEARLYSEDPARGFLPATGTVLALREPAGPGVRVDSSLADGLVVTADYDPMLAKIVAHGDDRAQALDRLTRALSDTVVLGVRTNLGFLLRLLATEEVRAGDLDTGLIERRLDDLVLPPARDDLVIAAALFAHEKAGDGPWHASRGWRLGAPVSSRYSFRAGPESTIDVSVAGSAVEVDGSAHDARMSGFGATRILEVDGTATPVTIAIAAAGNGDARTWVAARGRVWDGVLRSRAAELADHRSTLTRAAGVASPDIRTPMPGTVVAVAARSGDSVEEGQLLVTVEAMKMEHKMLASLTGVVRIDVVPGDLVSLDQVVASISPHEGASE